jgi:hypothetical protein
MVEKNKIESIIQERKRKRKGSLSEGGAMSFRDIPETSRLKEKSFKHLKPLLAKSPSSVRDVRQKQLLTRIISNSDS